LRGIPAEFLAGVLFNDPRLQAEGF
jgi:hypothetical protein